MTERDVLFATLPTAQGVDQLALPPSHFVTLLAWNADGASTETVSSVVEKLFAGGASYLCTWGRDCERVHDIAEEIDAYPSELASPEKAVRMTTWHDNETLPELARFFLENTEPDEYYASSTKSALVLCIGPAEFAAKVREAIEGQLNANDAA
jgi:hypothetical protein